MSELEQMGVTFALDDFGSGNAVGEKPLNSYKFSSIKLDRKMFLDGLKDDFQDVKNWCDKIKAINPKAELVLEGVEWDNNPELKEERLTKLKNAGITTYQGFGFSKPISNEELIKILQEQTGYTPSEMQ